MYGNPVLCVAWPTFLQMGVPTAPCSRYVTEECTIAELCFDDFELATQTPRQLRAILLTPIRPACPFLLSPHSTLPVFEAALHLSYRTERFDLGIPSAAPAAAIREIYKSASTHPDPTEYGTPPISLPVIGLVAPPFPTSPNSTLAAPGVDVLEVRFLLPHPFAERDRVSPATSSIIDFSALTPEIPSTNSFAIFSSSPLPPPLVQLSPACSRFGCDFPVPASFTK